jgi:hypothetical protein
MGIVNRYAKGLLTVLDSQTQGDTPSSMGDVIAPTMDVSEFLLASKGSVQLQTQNIFIGLGQVVEAPVPAGEQWWVRSVHLEVITRDAVVGNWVFALFAALPGIQVPLTSSFTMAMAAVFATSRTIFQDFNRPFVMKTGDALATSCQAVTGAPVLGVNAILTVNFDRLSA